MKSEGFAALEAFFPVWEGESWMQKILSAVSISYLGFWCPSRLQKNQVWIQPLNFFWKVVIMPCLLAEGISGLVQRISDSTSISLFSYSVFGPCYVPTSSFCICPCRWNDTLPHRDLKFLSPEGPHFHPLPSNHQKAARW